MPQAERMSVRLCPCVSDVSGVGEQEYIAEIETEETAIERSQTESLGSNCDISTDEFCVSVSVSSFSRLCVCLRVDSETRTVCVSRSAWRWRPRRRAL